MPHDWKNLKNESNPRYVFSARSNGKRQTLPETELRELIVEMVAILKNAVVPLNDINEWSIFSCRFNFSTGLLEIKLTKTIEPPHETKGIIILSAGNFRNPWDEAAALERQGATPFGKEFLEIMDAAFIESSQMVTEAFKEILKDDPDWAFGKLIRISGVGTERIIEDVIGEGGAAIHYERKNEMDPRVPSMQWNGVDGHDGGFHWDGYFRGDLDAEGLSKMAAEIWLQMTVESVPNRESAKWERIRFRADWNGAAVHCLFTPLGSDEDEGLYRIRVYIEAFDRLLKDKGTGNEAEKIARCERVVAFGIRTAFEILDKDVKKKLMSFFSANAAGEFWGWSDENEPLLEWKMR